MTTLSAKTLRKMLQGRAPSALRMPNSRVRSLTVMSIMFEMLTTPLNKVRMPTTHKPVRKMRVAVFRSFAPSALLSIHSVV